MRYSRRRTSPYRGRWKCICGEYIEPTTYEIYRHTYHETVLYRCTRCRSLVREAELWAHAHRCAIVEFEVVNLKNVPKAIREKKIWLWEEVKHLPKLEIVSNYPPFVNADDFAGNELMGVEVLTPHRMIETTNRPCIEIKHAKFSNVEWKDADGNKVSGRIRSFSLNRTGQKELIRKFGDNSDDWVGKKIDLEKVRTKNPRTNKTTTVVWVRVEGD